jgi:hypothetical protein
MGLMAGVAGDALSVVGGNDLREGLGLGTVRFVAAGADDGSVKLLRFDSCGIIGVLGLRAVAGFARDDDVASLLFLVDDIGVASFADFVSGMSDGAGGDLGDGGAAVVAIFAEAAGDDGCAQDREGNQRDCHDSSEPDEMFYVLEQVGLSVPDRKRTRCNLRNDLGYL